MWKMDWKGECELKRSFGSYVGREGCGQAMVVSSEDGEMQMVFRYVLAYKLYSVIIQVKYFGQWHFVYPQYIRYCCFYFFKAYINKN